MNYLLVFVVMTTITGQPPPDCNEYLNFLDPNLTVSQFPRDDYKLPSKGFISTDSACWERPALSGDFYCFYSGLKSIPTYLPLRTRCIIFTGNQMTSLSASDVRQLINLQVLVLDSNPLVAIEGDFSHLPLQILSLEGTSLKGLPASKFPELKYYAQTGAVIGVLERDDFSNLSTKLRYLRLAYCGLVDSNPNTFKSLTSLEILDLSQNNFTNVPADLPYSLKTFRFLHNYNVSRVSANNLYGLEKLQNLSISAQIVDSGAFTNTPNLNQLKLEACAVVTNATSCLSKVKELVVYGSFCPDRKLYLKPYAFSGLRSLSSFTMDRISIATLPKGVLLGATNMTSLFIEFDTIDTVQDGAFAGIPNLQTLRLTNNYIPVTKPVDLSTKFLGSDLLPSLTLFDLSDFRISKLDDGTFDMAPNLVRLYLGYNMMTTLSAGVLENLHSLQYISL